MSNVVDQLLIGAHDDSASRDFEFARANIYNLIESQKVTVERLTELADRCQIARVYEVLGKFVETMVHSNEKLLDLQAKVRSLKDISSQVNGSKTINNQTAIFVGTTAELQKHFKSVMKKEDKNGATGSDKKMSKM